MILAWVMTYIPSDPIYRQNRSKQKEGQLGKRSRM
jgi:hypothetical protein